MAQPQDFHVEQDEDEEVQDQFKFLAAHDCATSNGCDTALAQLTNQLALQQANTERFECNMNASIAELLAENAAMLAKR